jgi:hypothetical protein
MSAPSRSERYAIGDSEHVGDYVLFESDKALATGVDILHLWQ